MKSDDPCAVCHSTTDVVRPQCCDYKQSICMDCVKKVDFCPFCRMKKDGGVRDWEELTWRQSSQRTKIRDKELYHRKNLYYQFFDQRPYRMVITYL